MTTLYKPPFIPVNGKNFTLGVPHYVQLDNTGGQGFRECNLTSNASVCQYLTGALDPAYKKRGYAEPEDIYAVILAKYGDTTDHAAQTKALRDFGIESYFSYNTDINELAFMVRQGFPINIGTEYKGSGHMVTVYGMWEHGFRVLCPNGIRAGSANWWHERFYSEASAKPDMFTFSLMKRIFTPDGHTSNGWSRVITSVGGKKTSLHPDVLGKII